MAAHSVILAWEIPGGLQSMRSHRVGHDSVTKTTNKFEKSLRHSNADAWWQLAIGIWTVGRREIYVCECLCTKNWV